MDSNEAEYDIVIALSIESVEAEGDELSVTVTELIQ